MLTCANCGRESPDDFAFCPACAAPLAPPTAAREIRKSVTVVFCDVTGSTALGERLDPESLRDVQTRYFDAMRASVERHEGTVEKYIGDAVMAVFGIPRLHEDDALRAVRAASDMREGLKLLNKELERDRGVTIQVRIGVNTGEVVAGDDPSGQALVTGDAVNVAARLEQHAPPGEVLIGEATHRLVRDAVEVGPVEPVVAKGKAEPVRAWRLVDVRDVVSAVPRRLDSPMVGRERQLAQLRQAFEGVAQDRACHLFTILGAAGVGKSRLIGEFLAGLEDAEVLRGRCLPYGEGITYFPVVETIKQAAGLADFDLADVVESKVCSLLEGEEHQDLICRHIAQLMGVGEAFAGEETFWAVRRFFEATARERPLVLVFDDIHWGEPTFLELVEHIADWTRGSLIFLLCMARPDLLDFRPHWGGGKLNATTVSLEPLGDDEAAALMTNLVGATDLPAEVATRIVETSEGNPLFVEQTLEMLIDDGRLRREGDRWVAAEDASDLVVPPSIQALLAARLDRLSSEERAVIEAAAVVGKEFFVGAVRDLVDERLRAEVPALVMALVRRELVRPERSTLPGEDAMRFRHLTIRDAAYDAIPKAQRAELHERFAAWLERAAGDAVAEQQEIVGYHLEQAHGYRRALGPADEETRGLAARAASALASAGRRALERRDDAAGTNLLRRAIALEAWGPAERAAALAELADALRYAGEPQAGFEAADEAATIAAATADRSLEWRARINRSLYAMLLDPHGTPTEHVRSEIEGAIRLFDELGDDDGWATAWLALAETEWMPCRYDTAERAVLRALERVDALDPRIVEHAAMILLGTRMLGSATPELMRAAAEEVTEMGLLSRVLELVTLDARALAATFDDQPEDAARIAAEGMAVAEAIGTDHLISQHEDLEGMIAIESGDIAAAERLYRRAYDSLIAEGDEGHASTYAAQVSWCLTLLGRHDEADRFAALGRDLGAEDDVATQAMARSALALVRSARAEHEDAERLAREGLRMYEDVGAECPVFVGRAWMDLATVLRGTGARDDAAAAATRALEQFELKGARPSAERARAFVATLGE